MTRFTYHIVASAVIAVSFAAAAHGQVVVSPRKPMMPAPVIGVFEKVIAADAGVSVKLPCVAGEVSVNGRDKNEVRVFVDGGNDFELKVQERAESGLPAWLVVAAKQTTPGHGQCLSGRIDIDAPMGAFIDVTGRRAEVTVDSVKKAKITNLEGNITLRKITGGLVAATYQGDLTVEDSSGDIALESTTGNVLAFQVRPGNPGDLFRVKTTNGAISLQNVEHRQIDAGSISGSLLFDGKLLNGGMYRFKTSNGSLRLTLPADSSFQLSASYGFGKFGSELPLKTLTENVTETAKIFNAQAGSGEATVSLTTNSGDISIRKQKP